MIQPKKNSVKIPYAPRNWAKIMHASTLRWIVLVLHRRAGKTVAAINHLQRDALRTPNSQFAYLAPTYKQAKRIVWSMVKKYSATIPGIDYNENELLVKYPNGSNLMVLGSDNPDSLRGIGLWGAFLDEYPQQSPLVFTEIVSKCLADHLGYCIFGGTPKGKGHFHKIYSVAQKALDWCCIYRTIDDSLKNESGQTIDNLRQALEDDRRLVKQGLMTEAEFQQEWYNSFEAAIRGAVYLTQLSYMRENNRITSVPWDPGIPVFTVWDLGISKSDAMAVGFFQKTGAEPRLIEYYESIGTGLPHCIKYVKEKKYVYGKHFAPHDIRNKEIGTGKTRLSTAANLGINFEVIPKINVDDGIDLARSMMMRLVVDKTKAENWIDLIGSYKYEFDETRGILSSKPIHDFTSHAADMIRYAAVVEDQMTVDDVLPKGGTDVEWENDEYKGNMTAEEFETGKKHHPMLKGVDIGKMGHTKRIEE